MTNIASKLKWAMGMLALAVCIHAIPTFASSLNKARVDANVAELKSRRG